MCIRHCSQNLAYFREQSKDIDTIKACILHSNDDKNMNIINKLCDLLEASHMIQKVYLNKKGKEEER
jgi:hypothetical protein